MIRALHAASVVMGRSNNSPYITQHTACVHHKTAPTHKTFVHNTKWQQYCPSYTGGLHNTDWLQRRVILQSLKKKCFVRVLQHAHVMGVSKTSLVCVGDSAPGDLERALRLRHARAVEQLCHSLLRLFRDKVHRNNFGAIKDYRYPLQVYGAYMKHIEMPKAFYVTRHYTIHVFLISSYLQPLYE